MRLRLCVLLSAFLALSTGVSATNLTNIDGVKPSQDGKVDIYGTLDLGGNSITGVPAPASDTDAAPRRWINENDDTIPDTVIPDDQTISTNNDVSGTDDRISIDNGNSITIDDDFSPDTTVPDNQGLSTSSDVSGTDDRVSIDNGNSITIDDDFSPDTTVPDDQNIQVSSSGDTITVNIDNGNGGSASIQDNVADGDTDDTNELQNLEQTRSRNNNVNGDIDFQSSGSIISLENLNVDSINSNKGNDPVDLDQGIDLDGSTIVDDNDNTVNIADSLDVANNLNINGRIRVDAIEDRGTGNTITADSNINLKGNKITNLASPDNPSDAATKNYVDSQTSSSGTPQGLKKTWTEDFSNTGGYAFRQKTLGVFSGSSAIVFDPYSSKRKDNGVNDGKGSPFRTEWHTFYSDTLSKTAEGRRYTVVAEAHSETGNTCSLKTRILDTTNSQTIVEASATANGEADGRETSTKTKDYSFSDSSIDIEYQYRNGYHCSGEFNRAYIQNYLTSGQAIIDPNFSPSVNRWGTATFDDVSEPGSSQIKVDVLDSNNNVIKSNVDPPTQFSGVPASQTPRLRVRATRQGDEVPSLGFSALIGYR